MKSILAVALIATLMACTPEPEAPTQGAGGGPRETESNVKEK